MPRHREPKDDSPQATAIRELKEGEHSSNNTGCHSLNCNHIETGLNIVKFVLLFKACRPAAELTISNSCNLLAKSYTTTFFNPRTRRRKRVEVWPALMPLVGSEIHPILQQTEIRDSKVILLEEAETDKPTFCGSA